MTSPSMQDDITRLSECLNTIVLEELSNSEYTSYFYIRNLLNRISQKQHNLTSYRLLDKASYALASLQANQEKRLNEAEKLLDYIECHYLDAYDQAKKYFESKAYTKLRMFYLSLKHRAITDVFNQLKNNMHSIEINVHKDAAFNEDKQQAQSLIQQDELKSFKEYQTMFEKMSLDRLLARVMQEIPENAGPLNPERLVIRSFKTLQELSPDYLSRLISYYESLLTLQLLTNLDR